MSEFKAGVKYAVFSIRKQQQGSVWTRAGSAWVNRDGSMNLYLDVLPLDGTLHIREERAERDLSPEVKASLEIPPKPERSARLLSPEDAEEARREEAWQTKLDEKRGK